MNPQRVAMVSVHGSPLAAIGHKDTGGMNVYLGELSRELGRRGVEVDVFTRQVDPDAPAVVEPADNVRVVSLPAGPAGPLDKTELYPHLTEFLHGIQRFQQQDGQPYDIVHTHYWLSAWVGQKLGKGWDVPWAAMYHTLGRIKQYHRIGEDESDLRIGVERRTLAAADAVITGSETERRQIARFYGIPIQKTVTISPGVDLRRFQPQDRLASRAALGIAPDARMVLFVGRIEPLKGIDTLVRAAAAIENQDRLEVWIVGGDARSTPEVEKLQALGRRLGIADRLHFPGSVPHHDLPAWYSAADVCVVPSYYESFGMVALESLACGTPVVASRVGGLQETVHDGENGFLVAWRCPEPFAEKLERLLDNPGLRQAFSENAVATARRYDWPVVASRTLYLYECLIEARGCGEEFRPRRRRAS